MCYPLDGWSLWRQRLCDVIAGVCCCRCCCNCCCCCFCWSRRLVSDDCCVSVSYFDVGVGGGWHRTPLDGTGRGPNPHQGLVRSADSFPADEDEETEANLKEIWRTLEEDRRINQRRDGHSRGHFTPFVSFFHTQKMKMKMKMKWNQINRTMENESEPQELLMGAVPFRSPCYPIINSAAFSLVIIWLIYY